MTHSPWLIAHRPTRLIGSLTCYYLGSWVSTSPVSQAVSCLTDLIMDIPVVTLMLINKKPMANSLPAHRAHGQPDQSLFRPMGTH